MRAYLGKNILKGQPKFIPEMQVKFKQQIKIHNS